jgi:hypothetical protein
MKVIILNIPTLETTARNDITDIFVTLLTSFKISLKQQRPNLLVWTYNL